MNSVQRARPSLLMTSSAGIKVSTIRVAASKNVRRLHGVQQTQIDQRAARINCDELLASEMRSLTSSIRTHGVWPARDFAFV